MQTRLKAIKTWQLKDIQVVTSVVHRTLNFVTSVTPILAVILHAIHLSGDDRTNNSYQHIPDTRQVLTDSSSWNGISNKLEWQT